MKKLFAVFVLVLSLLILNSSLLINTALAVCPVCTVAVIAGLGVSRALGIDDIVTSIWIGGLILSASFWLIDWMQKKWPKLKIVNYKLLIVASMYLLVLIPLKLDQAIGIVLNRLWGIDKIILGVAIGSVTFLTGMWADRKVRKIKGKQLFIYQKVIFPILALIVTSLIFYFITR
ncbi:MAG: hypothetical protein NTZ07_03490 [Candidatus Woesebacteria bacterium]|nr:hypothetical protein [Candidatus Woesebacteria bacterium]